MSEQKQDPTPYLEMKAQGRGIEEIFMQAKNDGYKNFECIALICGVFEISLHEAREIAHKILLEKS